jgi:hypothetical protein
MKEKWSLLRKSHLLSLFVGFLWLALARLAFQFLPPMFALLMSAALFALLIMLFPFPKKQKLEQDLREELTESKRTWRRWNK